MTVPLDATQIAHEEGRARADLIGLNYLEIEEDREQARTRYIAADTAADGDQDDPAVRLAEIRMSVCSSVLTWMQAHGIEHYDGRALA